MKRLRAFRVAACAVALFAPTAYLKAQEAVRVAIGVPGNLESSVVEVGIRAGTFSKRGLKAETFYTAGSGETLQLVGSGSFEFGVSVGTAGALAAADKGAPIRIVGSASTGSVVYYYVKSSSPIRTVEDLRGRTFGYPTTGSSPQVVGQLLRARGIDVTLVNTGNLPATLTQVMTGQVDVGYAPPEFGNPRVSAGEVRIVFADNDFERIRTQSVRLIISNKEVPAEKSRRFVEAYRDTVDFIYGASDDAVRLCSELIRLPFLETKEIIRRSAEAKILYPDQLQGITAAMEDAVQTGLLNTPISAGKLQDLLAAAPVR